VLQPWFLQAVPPPWSRSTPTLERPPVSAGWVGKEKPGAPPPLTRAKHASGLVDRSIRPTRFVARGLRLAALQSKACRTLLEIQPDAPVPPFGPIKDRPYVRIIHPEAAVAQSDAQGLRDRIHPLERVP